MAKRTPRAAPPRRPLPLLLLLDALRLRRALRRLTRAHPARQVNVLSEKGVSATDIKKLKESGVHTTKVRLRALLSARAGSALRARRRL